MTNIYDTFGNEVKYTITGNTMTAYLENATVKFVLPEASSTILGTLVEGMTVNTVQLDVIKSKLIDLGFEEIKAGIMATVMIAVAQQNNEDPLDYFDDSAKSLKFAEDAYQIINLMRPTGNQIGVKTPIKNSRSRVGKMIKP